MPHDHLADPAVSCDDVQNSLGYTCLARKICKEQGCQGGVFGRLQDYGIPHCQSGSDFPSKHQQRKVPGNYLSTNSYRLPFRQLVFHELRHTGVVIEVTCDQWDIDVTALSDRLAIVERLQHGEEARLFLDDPCNRVEDARAGFGVFRPGLLRLARSSDCGVDILGRGLADLGQRLTRGRVFGRKGAPGFRPGAADEVAELTAVTFEPFQRFGRVLGRRAVFHGLENVLHGHVCLIPSALRTSRRVRNFRYRRPSTRYHPQ